MATLTTKITKSHARDAGSVERGIHKTNGRKTDWSRRGNRGRKDSDYTAMPAWFRALGV